MRGLTALADLLQGVTIVRWQKVVNRFGVIWVNSIQLQVDGGVRSAACNRKGKAAYLDEVPLLHDRIGKLNGVNSAFIVLAVESAYEPTLSNSAVLL